LETQREQSKKAVRSLMNDNRKFSNLVPLSATAQEVNSRTENFANLIKDRNKSKEMLNKLDLSTLAKSRTLKQFKSQGFLKFPDRDDPKSG
jgi:hypothetical protein